MGPGRIIPLSGRSRWSQLLSLSSLGGSGDENANQNETSNGERASYFPSFPMREPMADFAGIFTISMAPWRLEFACCLIPSLATLAQSTERKPGFARSPSHRKRERGNTAASPVCAPAALGQKKLLWALCLRDYPDRKQRTRSSGTGPTEVDG